MGQPEVKVNKSKEIRAILAANGTDFATKDVIMMLRERGIEVANYDVSNVRTAMRKQKEANASCRDVTLADLQAAKRWVKEAGSIDMVRKVLDTLEEIRE